MSADEREDETTTGAAARVTDVDVHIRKTTTGEAEEAVETYSIAAQGRTYVRDAGRDEAVAQITTILDDIQAGASRSGDERVDLLVEDEAGALALFSQGLGAFFERQTVPTLTPVAARHALAQLIRAELTEAGRPDLFARLAVKIGESAE